MSKNFWENLKKPIVALAPMDGYTDSAFRRVCKIVNPEIILFTEFTSADGLFFNSKKVKEKFKFYPDEKPIIAQIFGKDLKTFVYAAKFCESIGFAGIDLNMGCSARRVVKSEHGIALRKKPEFAFKLIEAVADSVNIPVSVKTRLGWDSAEDLIFFGQGAQAAGARCLSIHGRTYSQGFGNNADFDPIYELKKSLNTIVIGNGDISSLSCGLKKIGNLDGFMIGRAAIGNPWVFSRDTIIKFSDKIRLIKKHSEFLAQAKGESRAVLEIRKHLVKYVCSVPNASDYRAKLVKVSSLEEIKQALDEINAEVGQAKNFSNKIAGA